MKKSQVTIEYAILFSVVILAFYFVLNGASFKEKVTAVYDNAGEHLQDFSYYNSRTGIQKGWDSAVEGFGQATDAAAVFLRGIFN